MDSLSTTIDDSKTINPPSYHDTAETNATTRLPTSELVSLTIEGEAVCLSDPPSTVLYELTQSPVAGRGKMLAVQQIVYKPTTTKSSEPAVKSRLRHLYDISPPNYLPQSMLGVNSYIITSQLGPTHCFRDGAALVKGKATCLGTVGKSWHVWAEVFVDGKRTAGVVLSTQKKRFGSRTQLEWKDAKGVTVAVEIRPNMDKGHVEQDLKPRLDLKKQMDDKTLHLLVSAWCSALWHDAKAAQTPSLTI